MNPTKVGAIAFAFTFGGVMVGLWLRSRLPTHHFDRPSEHVIARGIGLIATMTALVLGLVTASAKSSFDAVNAAVKESAVRALALDRVLARYGPDTADLRAQLKQAIGERIEMVWPSDSSRAVAVDATAAGMAFRVESLADALRALVPRDDSQRLLQARAVDLAEGMLQSRWVVMAGTEESVPTPFLVVLLFWLTVAFVSFGMFAPRNGTVIAVLLVCAVSIGGALFLVLEMNGPFDGLLRASADPLRFAYSHINR
jgi:hypothetical protein